MMLVLSIASYGRCSASQWLRSTANLCLTPSGLPPTLQAPDGRWVACRPGFFLSVRVLSSLYRRLFLERLQSAFDAGAMNFFGDLAPLADPAAFTAYLRPLRQIDWVVYAKRPFGGPQQVLDYLGRYTHRVAIANSRIIGIDDAQVRFRWKDYRQPDKPKVMTLNADEFIRRFLLHVLPDGFRKIRHFGFLANAHRTPSSPPFARCSTCRRLTLTCRPATTARDTPCSPVGPSTSAPAAVAK